MSVIVVREEISCGDSKNIAEAEKILVVMQMRVEVQRL